MGWRCGRRDGRRRGLVSGCPETDAKWRRDGRVVLLHRFVRVLQQVLASWEQMGRAAGRSQRCRVVAGVGGRCGCGGGGRVHRRGVMGRHGRSSAHVQPSAGGSRLVHVPPTGTVDGGRFLLDVLLELPRLLVRMVGRARVHVRRLRMAKVEVATVRRGGRRSHTSPLMVRIAHAESGTQTGDGWGAGAGRRGRLALLPVLRHSVERLRVVVVDAVGRGGGGQRVVAAGGRRRTGCRRTASRGGGASRRFLPRMESLADGSVSQRRRTLGRQFAALGGQHGQRCASQSWMFLFKHSKSHQSAAAANSSLNFFFSFFPPSFLLNTEIISSIIKPCWNGVFSIFNETLITIDPSLCLLYCTGTKREKKEEKNLQRRFSTN